MATYPSGMTLRGELRESVSLDEDDLSDVEDEVFIRDGKNGYKLAEEMNVKRPLMAPRRKLTKPDFSSRIKNRPPCRAFCKPCCYIFAAISVLIGLIILVVILVSLFPLPLNRLRDWIVRKAVKEEPIIKLSPCNNLNVSEVWTTNIPYFSSESPVRIVDVNGDGFGDVLFGFGTSDANYNLLPASIFCPLILGIQPPCKGGVIAIDGYTGDLIWRHWLNDTIFSLECTADINNDLVMDCLAFGEDGTVTIINSKNGLAFWKINPTFSIYLGNFVPDQNNDNVSDILLSHSSYSDASSGHIILLSGKTGEELKRANMENEAKSFFMPQLYQNASKNLVVLGSGDPNSGGNLTVVAFAHLFSNNTQNFSTSIYEDKSKGMLTQSVLVDITGDQIPDIINAMYKSTLLAIDGKTFEQIWNFTIPGLSAETNIVATPAYFNSDNITDFLIVYVKFDAILNRNYSQTYIIDGKSGQSIYQPIVASISTQLSGLSLSMERLGYDMFIYWTMECPGGGRFEECFNNSSTVLKLNALNQYHQPPGLVIYNSVNRTSEFPNERALIMQQAKEYFNKHPITNIGQSELNENYGVDPKPIGRHKYGGESNFRHKEKNTALPKDYNNDYNNILNEFSEEIEPEPDFPNNYEDDVAGYNENLKERDPRSKEMEGRSTKKNLADAMYATRNVKLSKGRLLHDADALPTEILRDTFLRNQHRSKFEPRDINGKHDVEDLLVNKTGALNLWDLETEKEIEDRKNSVRSKRSVEGNGFDLKRITSVGAVLSSFKNISNTIDVVFITFEAPVKQSHKRIFEIDLKKCIDDRIKSNNAQIPLNQKSTEAEQKAQIKSDCLIEQETKKSNFPYYSQLLDLNLGQMTVHRMRVECLCEKVKLNERCAKFLPAQNQRWPEFLGRNGNGVFPTRG